MTAGLLAAIASGLAFWPGLFLVAGGLGKALELRVGDVPDTVAARLLPRWAARPEAWVVAALELAIGALVLAGALAPRPEAAAALLLGAAALVSAWGVRNAPDADCGCLGGLAPARVSRRTVARAGLLAGLAAVAVAGGEGWTSVFGHAVAVAVVAAAGVPLLWLSPELRAAAGSRLGVLRDAACVPRAVSLERSLARLRSSDVWERARPYLAADAPTEHWEQGCWRLVCYPAVYEGVPATAVFRVHLGLRHGGDGVAFVDEDERRVLGRL